MQRLLGLMIALALLIVPMGMMGGAAGAHTGAMPTVATTGCHDGQSTPEKPSDHAGMSAECAVACAALAAMSVTVAAPRLLPRPFPSAAARPGLTDAGPESLDPPPRA